jgi:hypothetical protein
MSETSPASGEDRAFTGITRVSGRTHLHTVQRPGISPQVMFLLREKFHRNTENDAMMLE